MQNKTYYPVASAVTGLTDKIRPSASVGTSVGSFVAYDHAQKGMRSVGGGRSETGPALPKYSALDDDKPKMERREGAKNQPA